MYVERDVSVNTSFSVGAVGADLRIGTVIHTTEGYDSLGWLQSGSAKVGTPASADCLINRDGSRYWLTPRGRYAFHAGKSTLEIPGRPGQAQRIIGGDRISQLLLGVEIERAGEQLVTDQQIDSLAEFIALRAIKYGWRWPYLIVGHYSIARPLGRRSDPVNFDWGAFAGRLVYWSDFYKVPGIALKS